MLQVSRKFEYGLHAVTYLATKGGERVVTVKEMAEEIGFSQEFLSKALQSLNRAGIVRSVQGVRGGYALARLPADITVADIGVAIEGKPHIVRCVVDASSCEISPTCQYKGYLHGLQKRIHDLMASTSVESLLQSRR